MSQAATAPTNIETTETSDNNPNDIFGPNVQVEATTPGSRESIIAAGGSQRIFANSTIEQDNRNGLEKMEENKDGGMNENNIK